MNQQELNQRLAEFAHEHNVPVEKCHPIPKEELINGIEYEGECRNASKAIWDSDAFIYMRTKFGSTYPEIINHYEDDDGYDVFVPIKIVL